MKTISAIIGSAALAISGSAHSRLQDFQYHAGSDCTNYYGAHATAFNHEIWGIVNMSNSPKYISCPLVDTQPYEQTVGTLNGIRVLVAGTGTFTCTLRAHDMSGNVFSSQMASRTGSGWLVVPNVGRYVEGFFTFHCQLPAYGWLQTYRTSL